MRIWFSLITVFAVLTGTGYAQKKINKMNGLSVASATKKKYNKQWIKMRQDGLPAFAFSVGASGGQAKFTTTEPNITQFGSPTLIAAPELTFHINPTRHFGVNLGLGYRNTSFAYTSSGLYQNDSIAAQAKGNWQQKFGNISLSFGLSYYGNIAKHILSCTGFGIVKHSTVHFYIDMGGIYAPSLFNEVYFQGSYTKTVNGELRENEDYKAFTIMYTNMPRRDPMTFFYAKAGFRIQSGDFATRIGPVFNYQLNMNKGLLNDFTSGQSSMMMYGVNLAFEFF